MVRGRAVPFVVALALALSLVAATGAASAERRRKPLRYIFVEPDSLYVGRAPAIATAMDVVDADGLRRVLPDAGFGNSYPHRRFLAWHGDAARARYVLVVDPTVDAKRVMDVIEMFEEPVAIAVKGEHGVRASSVVMGRATDDDASPHQLLIDRSTSTLYDSADGRVKAVADVDASAVGVRAKTASAFSAVLASLEALEASDQAIPVTIIAAHPRERLQPAARFGALTVVGSLDVAVLQGELHRFRAQVSNCFARERADDPTIEGPMTIELDIGEDGAVTDARAFGPAAVASCTVLKARELRLTPPASGTATVTYPARLYP
jgi:hypothetical protein